MRKKKQTGPQSLDALLHKEGKGPSSVAKRAYDLFQLNEQASRLLPQELSGHYRLAAASQHDVTILVDSAALSMRMQFEKQHLLIQLQQQFPGLQNIHVKITPALASNSQPGGFTSPFKPRVMSKKSALLLEEIAENAPPELQKQLRRLSRHGMKKPA